MLVTEDRHAYLAFPFNKTSGSKIWRTVSLQMHLPYFFVNYAMMEDKEWFAQTSILWREDDLLDFCRENQDTPSTKIIQVALLAPPRTNEINAWRMITLKEIWRGKIQGHQHREMVYVGVDGEKLLNSVVTDDESQVELLERVYPLTAPVTQTQEKPKTGRKRR